MHLAAALETAAGTPEDGAALQPVQIHPPLSGEAQE
jgi:hypothetical protein